MENFFVGVDVGTGSVRAALVDEKGHVLKTCVKKIQTWNPQPDHFEQSSEDIWSACVHTIKSVVDGYLPKNIKGIGFDATCSLVAISDDLKPIAVNSMNDSNRNIILWMDHRAKAEADKINQTNHEVLKYVGGKVSLEMEIPKLLWIKTNLPETWKKTKYFFDLPDYLTWKATGSDSRSLCSLVCKWNYIVKGKNNNWDESFLRQIGLEDLIDNNFEKIGNRVLLPGQLSGNGLCSMASMEMGLSVNTPIGTSLIDAHAGGLGMIGCNPEDISTDFESRLGLICGTSTCHMAITKNPIFVPGVWGPYYSAMVPGYWLSEAGQSASGALIDYVLNSNSVTKMIEDKCSKNNVYIQDYLNEVLFSLAQSKNLEDISYLTKDLHMWPDFHGNRSPIADPTLLGMISGLNLSNDENDLSILYLATLQALAYGTKHIIDTLIKAGHKDFSSVLMCGGLSKNEVFVKIHADVLGLPIICPNETESVMVGAAILGAQAANPETEIDVLIRKMGGSGKVVRPCPKIKSYHDKKYKVFLKMLQDQQTYKTIMSEV